MLEQNSHSPGVAIPRLARRWSHRHPQDSATSTTQRLLRMQSANSRRAISDSQFLSETVAVQSCNWSAGKADRLRTATCRNHSTVAQVVRSEPQPSEYLRRVRFFLSTVL